MDTDRLISQFYEDDIAGSLCVVDDDGVTTGCEVTAHSQADVDSDGNDVGGEVVSFQVVFMSMMATERYMTSHSEYMAKREEYMEPVETSMTSTCNGCVLTRPAVPSATSVNLRMDYWSRTGAG